MIQDEILTPLSNQDYSPETPETPEVPEKDGDGIEPESEESTTEDVSEEGGDKQSNL